MDQLEGRNPVVEVLQRGRRRVARIWLDQGAKIDARLGELLALAEQRGVVVERVGRQRLDKMAEGRVHQGVVAHAAPLPDRTTRELLDEIHERGDTPFLVLADEVSYEHNLGAILRSCLGFGVHGLIVPTRRGAGISPVVQRVSMGAVEDVPLVREGLSSALRPIRQDDVRVVGADMGGVPIGAVDLRGPIAVVMGGEGKGLSPVLRDKCDVVVSIPLAGRLESLNVSVAASVILYEKRRQDGWFSADGSSPR